MTLDGATFETRMTARPSEVVINAESGKDETIPDWIAGKYSI